MTETAINEGQETYEEEVRRNLPRNYAVHCVEGGLFIGGIAFVAPETVLPKVVESLQGPTWLIAAVPMMMKLGFVIPTLFTAHLVERWPNVKPAVLLSGFFQRVAFLAPAVILYFFADSHPTWALASVALAPLLSGVFGGMTMTAWLELVARTIPENRRSSVWAIRFIISSMIGIGAGGIISSVLTHYPGPTGYGILYFILFGFLTASYFIFALIRETSPPVDRDHAYDNALSKNLKSIPGLIRSDVDLRNYLITRSLMNGIYIMIPFLSIHALRVLEQPESFVGYLVMSNMIGGIAGNLMAGYLGDTVGGKVVMILSRLSFLVIAIWTSFATSTEEYLAIFFLFGAAFFANQVGTTTLCIELCPQKRRATYLGIMATLTAPTMVLSSLLSTFLWNGWENYSFLGLATGIAMVISLLYLMRIEEPRGRSLGHDTL
ncbi:MAG: MFS transporter [Candidatus Omnitrophica bacterium]|nr:MFS transporter [Candidatus Omnitrophota bacterium]MCA9445667.1 MFS transporter [Candidatus Omnitrophota bacterium]